MSHGLAIIEERRKRLEISVPIVPIVPIAIGIGIGIVVRVQKMAEKNIQKKHKTEPVINAKNLK